MITDRELMTSFGRVLTREEEKGVHIVGRVCVRTCFEILYERGTRTLRVEARALHVREGNDCIKGGEISMRRP